MTTTTHFCISLKNILKLYLEGKGGWLEDDNGRVLTESEVYQIVREEKAKGYTYFSGCDNRDSEGRCAGHLVTVAGEGK